MIQSLRKRGYFYFCPFTSLWSQEWKTIEYFGFREEDAIL